MIELLELFLYVIMFVYVISAVCGLVMFFIHMFKYPDHKEKFKPVPSRGEIEWWTDDEAEENEE